MNNDMHQRNQTTPYAPLQGSLERSIIVGGKAAFDAHLKGIHANDAVVRDAWDQVFDSVGPEVAVPTKEAVDVGHIAVGGM